MHREAEVNSVEDLSMTSSSFSQSTKLQFSGKQTEHMIEEEQHMRKSSYHETASVAQASLDTSSKTVEQQELTTLNHRLSDYLNQIKSLVDRNIFLRYRIDDIHQQFLNPNSSTTESHQSHRQLTKEVHSFVSFQIRFQRADYDKKSYQNRLRVFSPADQTENYREQIKADHNELSLLKDQYDKQEQDLEMYRQKYQEYTKKLIACTNEYQTRIFERMESEHCLATIQEQILFEREYIQRCQDEWKNLHFDIQFNQTDLKGVIEKIREDYRNHHIDQLSEYESVYQVKLQSIENAFHRDGKVHHSSDELKQLLERNRSLQLKTGQLQNDLRRLIEQNREKVELANQEYEQFELQLPQLESMIVQSRDSTVHLSSEINTYRCLLGNLVLSSNKKAPMNKKQENDLAIHYGSGIIWVRI